MLSFYIWCIFISLNSFMFIYIQLLRWQFIPNTTKQLSCLNNTKYIIVFPTLLFFIQHDLEANFKSWKNSFCDGSLSSIENLINSKQYLNLNFDRNLQKHIYKIILWSYFHNSNIIRLNNISNKMQFNNNVFCFLMVYMMINLMYDTLIINHNE